ncbi:hypothetical protein N431DRAFT_479089 [Stipitochalara longipes BDJ]|nr:hypothetical protein N431DRAFT_479089 [Stipitochalara longipes BDJ]
MAASLQSFRFAVRSCSCRYLAPRYASKSIGRGRELSTTPRQWKEASVDEIEERLAKIAATSRHAAEYLRVSKETDAEIAALDESLLQDEEESRQKYAARQQPYVLPLRRKRLKDTFMNMGDPEPWEEEGMLDDDQDDMPSLAHGELEQHREMRHYARLAAWEMPLLSQLAKPFEPPTADMPLRFRYTTYMGEQHPAEKKVVLEFTPADMPGLTDVQRNKLRKLAGVRWNPEEDIVKMSCEMFETQAQNKRYLGDLVEKLLEEAKDPIDTFEDVPFDTRHHHFKSKLSFPQEWNVTEQRRVELVQYRQAIAEKDQQLELAEQLVDGIKQIEEGLAKQQPIRESLPEMLLAARRPGAKGKKVGVRR